MKTLSKEKEMKDKDVIDLAKYQSIISEQALELWGGEEQLLLLIEEMGELIQAIIKYKRGLEHNIAEEIADVEILLTQVKLFFDNDDEIYKWKNFKYERIKNLIAEKVVVK
jgi:NTP pyrophosphatase (non-canonical NTP hydrolase)